MNALERAGRWVCGRWLAVPYRWRRRFVIGAVVWMVFRILAWQWGFERLVLYLLVAVVVSYVVVEVGLRRLVPASTWLYRQFTGQLLGIVFAMLVPLIAESWVRLASEPTVEMATVAVATTAVILYTWWAIRKLVFAPADEYERRRRASRGRRGRG